MQLSEIFQGLGEDTFAQLLRAISIGKLKTYQLFDRLKARMHLAKMNSESLRKAEPRFWARLGERDEDFATDLSQAILVSHLDMIKAVLDHLGIPNEDGFFAKDIDGSKYLTEGGSKRRTISLRMCIPNQCCCSTSIIWIGKSRRVRRYSKPRRDHE